MSDNLIIPRSFETINDTLSANHDISNISKGVAEIIKILFEVSQLYEKHTVKLADKYISPRFIYRGVSAIYHKDSCDKKEKPQNSILNINGNGCKNELNAVDFDIRSGLSIKLKSDAYDKCKTHFSRIQYINHLEKLIKNARKHYPAETTNKDDLSILAEIQHYGGATCLVDFSKNLLTAIWFACQDNFECDSVLYCYDIMEDIIVNDNLAWLNEQDLEKKSIRDLLLRTCKDSNICGDIPPKFCIWEPNYQNLRMIRQDSLFVFGIEKFHLKEHSVESIVIKSVDKKDILQAMKTLFNITSGTIYDDYIGYAINHSKSKRDVGNDIEDNYRKALHNIIYGNYASARDYLKLFEGLKVNKKENSKLQVELEFSIATCYKNLHNGNSKSLEENDYSDEAIAAYRNVIFHAKNVIEKGKEMKEQEIEYYYKKSFRAYNNIIDLYFDQANYVMAYALCGEIIEFLSDKDNKTKAYCYVEKLELLDLMLLCEIKCPEFIGFDKTAEEISTLLRKNGSNINSIQDTGFFYLLFEYYRAIYLIITSDTGVDTSTNIDDFRGLIRKMSLNQDTVESLDFSDGYITWNFNDIKKCIEKSKCAHNKKNTMMQITAEIISLRDMLEMNLWNTIQKES